MSIPEQLPLAARAHNNQQLFSDYYLDMTLPKRADWKGVTGQAEPVMRAIAGIFAGYRPTSNENQTEDYLIKPILKELGHTFEVQTPLRTPDGTKKPDYVLYRDGAALNANKNRILTDELPKQGAFAVGDAKYWDRPLDQAIKSGTGDPFTNKNPSYQISFYIQHSGLEWGILTNGRKWRLYHKASAYKLDRFYEVDLKELVDEGQLGRFLYFYAFFHRAAFEPDHPLGVWAILRESADYAQGVGDTLKSQVYEALRHLAQGFLDYAPNGLRADPGTQKLIYDASLIVLYRMLFVLYAEARELLPVYESDQYRESYSFQSIKRAVQRDLDGGKKLLSGSAKLWPDLKELFGIINAGSPPLKVATFNGGLFDPAKHPFLERYTVGDGHLQQAIDKLARVKGQFVDYRDLAVRHLGTIYEGLLEYHIEALPPGGEREWSIALLNDKGERKATGSYYTPDYIVKYIVDQTVGPVVEAAVSGLEDDAARVEAALGLNVLDPAMGSGHFLVEATEYIAGYLVELGVHPTGSTGDETDLAYWKRRVAQSCIYGVDLNPLAVELAKLSLWLSTVAKDRPLSFLDHHLRAGNSLIGARISDLRLNAGLTAAQKRARKQERELVEAGYLSMLEDDVFRRAMRIAVDSMWLIEESPGLTVEQVKEQEQVYDSLRETLTRKYGRLADLVTATFFGLKVDVDPQQWQMLADYATGRAVAALPQFARWLEEADAIAEQRRFFHWELEFPEVFFGRNGQALGEDAGFDAVIGNPPYVRQETLGPLKPYFATAFRETYHGVADLYVYFYQQGLSLTRIGGRMSYIVTNKWMRAGYGEPLRAYFSSQGVLEQIMDFGHAPIFEEADVFPCILVLEKREPPGGNGRVPQQPEHDVRVTVFPREVLGKVELGKYASEHSHGLAHSRFGKAPWNLEVSSVDDLLAKIKRVGIPLIEFAGVKPYRGILTGLNEAFLIDTPTKERLVREDPKCAEVIRPYLRGQDIKRWEAEWQGLWMIFSRRGVDIERYPLIKQYLMQFRDRLEPRPRDWNGREWGGRKAGSYKWFEIQDAVDYWQLFEQPKIVYQEIQFHPQYGLDTGGLYVNNKVFILPSNDMWLLAVLNSPLMWWHNWRYLPHMKDEALTPVGVLMEHLPIARPTDSAHMEAEAAVTRLIAITNESQQARRDTLEWLRTEFGVESPGQRLEDFATLDVQSFVEEVRKRRPKSAGMLTPAALRGLRDGYAEQAVPVRKMVEDAARLERRIAELVNEAYELTAEEVALMWETAPPRMPRF